MKLQISKECKELNNFVNLMLKYSFSLFLHLSSFYGMIYLIRLVSLTSKPTFVTKYDIRKLLRFSVSHEK